MGRIVFIAKLIVLIACYPSALLCAQANQEKSSSLENLVRCVSDSLSDYPIVMLGEPTHGAGNILEIKTALLKELVEKHDFSVLAFESGIYDLWKAQQNNRDTPDIQNIKDGIFTIWTCSEQMVKFFSSLESWQKKIEVVGFDFQFSGEYASESILEDIQELFKTNKIPLSDSTALFWSKACEEMSENFDLPKEFDIQRFLSISEKYIDALERCKKTNDNLIWIQIFRSTAALAKDYFFNGPSSKNEKTWKAKDSNSRDRQMANNLLFYHKLFPKKKIICWGASAHLAKGFNFADSEELKSFVPMGKIIADSLGTSKVFSLAFTGATGSHGTTEHGIKKLESNVNTLEDSLSVHNVDYSFLPLKGVDRSFNAKPLEFSKVNNKWSSTFDGLFFINEITPNIINCSYREEVHQIIDKAPTLKEESLSVKVGEKSSDRGDFIESLRTKETYAGVIIDTKTKLPIPFATILFQHSNIGTIAEADGTFKLPKAKNKDSVIVSCIGYKSTVMPLSQLRESVKNTLYMKEETNKLNEVTVSGERLNAKMILKKVLKAFKSNYLQSSYELNFQLIQISKGTYIENISTKKDFNGYKFYSPYPGSDFEFKLSKSRSCLIDSVTRDTLKCEQTNQPIVSPTGFIDLLNYRKNSFLNPAKWRAYEFDLIEIIDGEQGEIFRIGFKCKRPTHFNTLQLAPTEYWGEILVSSTDYSIQKVITNTRQDKNKVGRHAYLYAAFKENFTWTNRTVVEYKKINGYYFLNRFLYASNWDNRNGFVQMQTLNVSH